MRICNLVRLEWTGAASCGRAEVNTTLREPVEDEGNGGAVKRACVSGVCLTRTGAKAQISLLSVLMGSQEIHRDFLSLYPLLYTVLCIQFC